MKRRYIIILILALVAVVLSATCAVLFVTTRMWQRWDIDAPWADAIVADAQEIRQQLEAYKASTGAYPDSLSRIQAVYRQPTDFASRGSTDKWHYRKLSKTDYQLFATGASWISSFDAMVFRASGNYPAHWFKALDSSHSRRFGDWHYITGFSSFERDP